MSASTFNDCLNLGCHYLKTSGCIRSLLSIYRSPCTNNKWL